MKTLEMKKKQAEDKLNTRNRHRELTEVDEVTRIKKEPAKKQMVKLVDMPESLDAAPPGRKDVQGARPKPPAAYSATPIRDSGGVAHHDPSGSGEDGQPTTDESAIGRITNEDVSRQPEKDETADRQWPSGG